MRVTALLLLLAVAGCARVQMAQSCREQAGPEPYAAGHAFGILGALVTTSQPEHQEWQQRVDACMQQRTASR
jgi:hypothetical protein